METSQVYKENNDLITENGNNNVNFNYKTKEFDVNKKMMIIILWKFQISVGLIFHQVLLYLLATVFHELGGHGIMDYDKHFSIG